MHRLEHWRVAGGPASSYTSHRVYRWDLQPLRQSIILVGVPISHFETRALPPPEPNMRICLPHCGHHASTVLQEVYHLLGPCNYRHMWVMWEWAPSNCSEVISASLQREHIAETAIALNNSWDSISRKRKNYVNEYLVWLRLELLTDLPPSADELCIAPADNDSDVYEHLQEGPGKAISTISFVVTNTLSRRHCPPVCYP